MCMAKYAVIHWRSSVKFGVNGFGVTAVVELEVDIMEDVRSMERASLGVEE